MELARSIVSRVRQFVGDRRHARRQPVRLPFTLSVASSAKGLDGTKRVSSVDGHTLDLTSNGMALIVPTIRLGEHHLMGENRRLSLKLTLPAGPVEMLVTPIRYETLDEDESQSGYLIGVTITEMQEDDRARFIEYVSSLPNRTR